MAHTAAAVTVADTATALHSQATAYGSLLVYNESATVTMYVGPSGVTTSSGMPVPALKSLSVPVRPGDRLYGIVASGTVAAQVLTYEG